MRLPRWTTVVIFLAAVLVLVPGCGRSGTTTAKPPQKRITFWHIQTTAATRQVIEDAAGRFEDKNPDVAVRTSAFKNDPFKQKLSQAMASGAPPDVFHTWGGGVLKSFVDEKQVLDLTASVEADNLTRRLLPAALRFATVDDRIYAIPMDVAVVVMWYNRDIFDRHGIMVPVTFDELKGACVKLRGAGVTPIALGNKDKWPGAFYFVYLAMRSGGAKPLADAASRTPGGSFEHPCFVQAGRLLQELVAVKAFNDGVNVLSHDEARDLFMRQEAAMILMGTWILAEIQSDAPALLDKIDCFAFPQVLSLSGDPKTILGGINSAYAISSRCVLRKEAFGLLKELISDTTAMKWAATGRIPALTPEATTGILGKHTWRAAQLLFAAPEIQLYYDQYLPPRLGEMHKETTQSLFAGTLTPEGAARKMEALARETTGPGTGPK